MRIPDRRTRPHTGRDGATVARPPAAGRPARAAHASAGLVLLTAALALFSPRAAVAQVPTLDRVDSLVLAGQYDEARTTLQTWWSAREEFDVPGSDMARALMLRGQLAPDPEAAEPHYLAVVLGYPTSPHAPDALLRLGQGLLAAGQASRAAGYLQRLAADYPGRARRAEDLLWLARAHNAARQPASACAAARQGLQAARDPDLSAMLRVEASASCALGQQPAGDQPGLPRGPVTEARPATAPAEPAREPAPAQRAAGDWTVQTGAFRYRRSADALITRLRDAGYEPRLVTVPRNDLLRVRIGHFTSSDEAARVVTRLRDLGFDALVVGDADEERQP